AATRHRSSHCALKLEHCRAGIANADRLARDFPVTWVHKQECAEGALAQHEEPEQGPQLVVSGHWIVAQKINRRPVQIAIADKDSRVHAIPARIRRAGCASERSAFW